MFQFSGFPSAHYGFMYGWQDRSCRVSPFRHLRIVAYVQLPAAFRSLSRLSSAPSARASALRPFLLNLLIFDLRFSGGPAIALAFLQFFDALLSARISPCVPQGVSIALVFRCLSTNPLQGFRSLRPLSDWCPHVASLFGFQGVIRGCTASTLGRFSSHQELGTSSPSLIASEA